MNKELLNTLIEAIKIDSRFTGLLEGESDEIVLLSFVNLERALRRYGNKPSRKQLKALLEVCRTYADILRGRRTGRFAFPLSCGLGKTQSIVALCTATYMARVLNPDWDYSVVVSASKVEALCDLKRDLMDCLIDEEDIGLIHSYKDQASLPSTGDKREDNENRPFLLVTHSRVRGKADLEKYNTYKGKPRNLLIWDETLFISNSRSIARRDFRTDLSGYRTYFEDAPERRDTIEYLNCCEAIIERELQDQQQKDRKPQAITFPQLTPVEMSTHRAALRISGKKPDVSSLHAFLDMCQEPLRVIDGGQGGLITYDLVVDKALENIVILDASHNIRELVKLDKSIQMPSRFSENIISYENVTVYQLQHASGRNTMTHHFGDKRRDNRKLSYEIAEVVKNIPKNEGVLVFTFKQRDKRDVAFADILRADLTAEGIDLKAKVKIFELEKEAPILKEEDRFVFLTWGEETSVSRFSYCSNVVFAGVLHRADHELASAICGQTDNLLYEIDHPTIHDVKRSEIAHCLYQAMSRGSCRVVDGDKTKPMKVWLVHKDLKIQNLIKKVMPGVKWKTWEPRCIQKDGKGEDIANKIAVYLGGLPDTEQKISTSNIKKALGLNDVPRSTFSDALSLVENKGCGWRLNKRSFERMTWKNVCNV